MEDLLNTEFMNVFQELYVSEDNKSIQIQVQNLRKTWTYRGILDILNVDEGEFCQIVNVLLSKVKVIKFCVKNHHFKTLINMIS